MDDLTSQNPSYQNYMAKQMLANPKAHGLTTATPELSTEPPVASTDTDKLGSLLDAIDSKRKHEPSDTSESSAADISSPFDWIKQFDPTYGVPYYYNYKTGQSQWERPEGFIETPTVAPVAPAASVTAASTTSSAGYAATFNAKTGSFSSTGQGTYWEQNGRPDDRAGRQMSAFFDLNDFERNREEAKLKKKQLQEMKGIDWRKYKEERKKKRQKISQRWLYEDD
mmetsp:Transcript_9503/g.14304  ORF Transcript_9503/g.14304 Transcript_9503/m.14304 type:complete len:225 (+) Transcript_9503:161-835(+)|eukprot:CAMPEP_0185027218 /NCGR_PEP_ID=MMETSP1103-20130426/11994_1 /TAXON_ID=36769 /ORGANISM="Paraphysomonas bandaiensis, Strain Caron Lab Isolate" /LENGTH=224 /DNA_ID=CAMNT_0027561105 /DNA_START=109 /DNA_END=783 /DNA_ORIENTATION=-